MKTYTSFDEIEYDLKRLKLERQIAWEKLKVVKSEFKDDIKPMNWVNSAVKAAGKLGLFVILKKLIK